jgi:hypothetical protein
MRIADESLAEVWDRGFTVVERFLDAATLKAAQDALWDIFPRPEDYFADPRKHPSFSQSQFSGLRYFPYPARPLNALAVYPDLIEAAERFLKSDDIEIYKIELWGKYAGAIDYDQPLHRDFANHTLVAPRLDGVHTQMTTFILLSDVTPLDGPTKLVPLEHTRDLPLFPLKLSKPLRKSLAAKEVSAAAPAGSLLIYKTDVLHRGSDFGAPERSRFAMLVDFQKRGWRWNGKMSWPNYANSRHMMDAMIQMTPRERDLFGWPPPGSEYWNAQTLRDVAARYPGMDMRPYAESVEGPAGSERASGSSTPVLASRRGPGRRRGASPQGRGSRP